MAIRDVVLRGYTTPASGTVTIVNVTGTEPLLSSGMPRIEAGDTYQFIKRFPTVPNSVTFSVIAPDNTVVVSLQTATQSGSTPNFFFFHTTTDSWFTTVDSSGIFVALWTAFRGTGDDAEKEYFEVIRTN